MTTAESAAPDLLLSGKFIKESNLSKSEWKSRTFELWSSGLLTYKNRVGLCDERNIKDAAFRVIEKKVPLPGKKHVVIKALEIKTANRKLTIAFHAESVEKNITHLEGFKKVIKENFNRDFLEDEPLSAELLSVDGKVQYVESDDSGDDEPAPAVESTATIAPTTEPKQSPTSPFVPPPLSSTASVAASSASGLEILKGNRDGIILAVIFGAFAFLLVVLDFLLKKL